MRIVTRRRIFIVSLLSFAGLLTVLYAGRSAELKQGAAMPPSFVTVPLADTLAPGGDVDGDGRFDPGDTILYTVTVTNNAAPGAGNDATGVTYTDTLPSTLTLVGGSINSTPIATDDLFSVTGNVSISVLDGPSDLLGNDVDPDTGTNVGLTATVQTKKSASCVSCTADNVSINANGSFSYNPPAGYTGTDSFTYTITDAGGTTATGTVTLNVSGMVWFIQNGAPACTTLNAGCGRLSNPFSSLAAFQALNVGGGANPSDNQNIFIYESATAYTGGVTLRTGQRLIGQDATNDLATITGITPPPFSTPFPAMNTGGNPVTIRKHYGKRRYAGFGQYATRIHGWKLQRRCDIGHDIWNLNDWSCDRGHA